MSSVPAPLGEGIREWLELLDRLVASQPAGDPGKGRAS